MPTTPPTSKLRAYLDNSSTILLSRPKWPAKSNWPASTQWTKFGWLDIWFWSVLRGWKWPEGLAPERRSSFQKKANSWIPLSMPILIAVLIPLLVFGKSFYTFINPYSKPSYYRLCNIIFIISPLRSSEY